MKQVKKYIVLGLALTGLTAVFPVAAQAGHVGWNVSVGGGYGGGGWRPAAYGPGWGGHYGPGWRGNWAYGGGYYGGPYGYPYAGYYSPPVVYAPPVAYAPPQPMVLTSQPQPAVWYFCQASGQFFPYVQECSSGWQAQPAIPPSSGVKPQRPNN